VRCRHGESDDPIILFVLQIASVGSLGPSVLSFRIYEMVDEHKMAGDQHDASDDETLLWDGESFVW